MIHNILLVHKHATESRKDSLNSDSIKIDKLKEMSSPTKLIVLCMRLLHHLQFEP